VIVIIGIPVAADGERGVAGTPALAALAAVRAGATIELVGKVGDDPAGDAIVVALGRQGVGHAALLRDPGRRTPIASAPAADDPAGFTAESDPEEARVMDAVDRSDWPVLEPEDVQLALRYLPDMRAIVVAEPVPDAVVTAAREAASYVAAPVVVVVADPASSPDVDVALAAPAADPDGAFAELLGQVSAALDRGVAIDEAFRQVSATLGVTPASA
jgi:sugar/nucleoside kinase (ribokinase family)